MNFLDWLEKEGKSIYQFSKENRIQCTTLYKYARGEIVVSKDMAIYLEKATGGEVPRSEFIWPTFKPLKKKKVGRPKKENK